MSVCVHWRSVLTICGQENVYVWLHYYTHCNVCWDRKLLYVAPLAHVFHSSCQCSGYQEAYLTLWQRLS